MNSSGATLNSHGYTYNAAGQRTQQTRTDASYVNYTYDNDGQAATAVGSGGQSTENLSYVYDAAWNLNQRTSAGVPTTFGVDNKNQLTSGPGGNYGYDGNGNLTSSSGSLISYSYDDENELTSVSAFQNWRTDLAYDGLARLRIRKEYTWNSSLAQWQQNSETHYLYDGRLVIQERDGSNNPTVSYTRGLDLSGTLQGAGGIGGLLARSTAAGTHAFYHADGNGNVTSMADNSQTVVASYRYDPFGKIIAQSGTLASANAYRFSSKEFLSTSSMYYYGYRLYDPNLQRWPNRDPIGELGPDGPNLYTFVRNDPLDTIDPDGLWTTAIHNYLIDHAFPNLTPAQLQILKDVSADVDSLYPGQLQKNSYQHAMSMPGENPDAAAAKWTKFLQDQQNKAKKCPDSNKALSDFGRGLHALADSTSPSHRGVQPWEPSHIRSHHNAEKSIGIDDYLSTINLMRQYYQTTFGEKAW